MRIKFLLRAILGLHFFFFLPAACYSVQVAFIVRRGEVQDWAEKVEVACQFYGLDMQVLTVGDSLGEKTTIATLKNKSTVAAIVSADALSLLDRRLVLSALKRPDRNAVPLMILEVTASTNVTFLKIWSAGAI